MGSRPRPFRSRNRFENREESMGNRDHERTSRGREERFSRSHLESPNRRVRPGSRGHDSSSFRGHEELSMGFQGHEELFEFHGREQSATSEERESARERIRRENERHDRGKGRSRSRNRHFSSERSYREGHSRSGGRRSCSVERKSEGLRFEPPDHRGKPEFSRKQKSVNDNRRGRYRSPHEKPKFEEDSHHMSSRFSPPQPEFHEIQTNNVEFESRPNFNPNLSIEMHENEIQLNGPSGGDGSINTDNRGYSQNQNFIPPLMTQPLTNKQEFSQNQIINQGFPQNHIVGSGSQAFPSTSGSFEDNSLQNFPVQMGITELGLGLEDDEAPLIPEFNPETSKLTSHEWVRLIDDTAKQYDWKKDEKQYILASRLSGFARQWFLTSGVNNKGWGDLKQAFLNAFPTEMSFHTLLQKMLARTKDENETMSSYFHHKVALLNACDIQGRKAVSCIIGGLQNVRLRQQARARNCEDPDELYLYLRSCDPDPPIRKPKNPPDDSKNKNNKTTTNTKECFFCKTVGHLKYQCPHYLKSQTRPEEKEKEHNLAYNNKVMHGSLSRTPTYSKYFTDVTINGIILKAYVDQGSECTTIREENAVFLKLPVKKQYKVIRGFGGSAISSIGIVEIPLCIDRAIANVKVLVVPDHLQQIPVIVGQTFTEQPHVVVMKDGDRIRLYQRMDNGETNFDF